MPRAERFTEPVAFHGEGPYWDAVGGRLLHVDMLAGDVIAVADDGSTTRHAVGSRVAAVLRPRASGGFVVAVETGFRFLDDDLAPTSEPSVVFDDPGVRMNEGSCDPQGRFYCGTMAYDQTPGAGAVWRLDPDGSVHHVLGGVTISNGIQWHGDGSTVSYVDTPTRRVDRFDFDADRGVLVNRRPFITFTDEPGNPDGTALDTEGGLWVATFGGSAVRRFDAAGLLSEVVEVPARNVTACAFGGADWRTLFITTSREGLGDDAEADAGAVFRIDAGVAGALLPAYAG